MKDDDDRLPGYYVSRDQESFTIGPYRTRKKAVDVAADELSLKQGDTFYVCLARWETSLFGPDADEVIERAKQAAEDNAPRDWGSEFLSEVSNEAITDLGGMLEQTWEVWLDHHNLRPKWFEATEVTKHVCDQSGKPKPAALDQLAIDHNTLRDIMDAYGISPDVPTWEAFQFAIGRDAEQKQVIAGLQSEVQALRSALENAVTK